MKIPVALLGALSLFVLPGCGGSVDAGGAGPRVAAAFYPFAYVAERVAGDHVEVVNLTSPGVEPHDLELTPQQVAEISEADLMVYEAGFQPAVDEAVEQNPPERELDVTDVVELQDTGTPVDDHADGGDAHSEDEHPAGEHSEPDLDGDPHLWQDPTLLVPLAEQVADDLAEIDPEHAEDFAANTQRLVDDLTRLDADFSQGLADCQRRTFVTSHAAFGYLANRYDLDMVPIAGLSPDIEPAPEQLAEIQDLIERDGITTVFSETLGSKEYADTLANDIGVQTAVLDPIEGLSDDDSDDDYFSLMRDNLAALREANGCT